MPLELDVTNSDSIKNVIEEAINKYKRPPSITVNCAGITRDSFILKMEESDFDLVMNVNLKVNLESHARQHQIDANYMMFIFRERFWS